MAKEKKQFYVTKDWQGPRGPFASYEDARQYATVEATNSPGTRWTVLKAHGHAKVEQPTIWTDYE